MKIRIFNKLFLGILPPGRFLASSNGRNVWIDDQIDRSFTTFASYLRRELNSHPVIIHYRQDLIVSVPFSHRRLMLQMIEEFRALLCRMNTIGGEPLRATKGGLDDDEFWSFCDGCGLGSQYRDDGHCNACYCYNSITFEYERIVSVAPSRVVAVL